MEQKQPKLKGQSTVEINPIVQKRSHENAPSRTSVQKVRSEASTEIKPAAYTPSVKSLDRSPSRKLSQNRSVSSSLNKARSSIMHRPSKMSTASIHFILGVDDYMHAEVPPPSLKSDLSFADTYHSLPKELPESFDGFDIPYVRDVGIRAGIEKLGEFLKCTDYKFSLVQFWFLDILIDCLWKVQDEYRFTKELQKVLMEWMIYIFELIRCKYAITQRKDDKAPTKNYSRQSMFQIFRDMIHLAEQHIESGCPVLPSPRDLFTFPAQDEQEVNAESLSSYHSPAPSSSSSCSSLHTDGDDDSYIALKHPEGTEFFKLPKQTCRWDEYVTSSVESLSERTLDSENEEPEHSVVDSEIVQAGSIDPSLEPFDYAAFQEYRFYQPNWDTPPRFRSLTDVQKPPDIESNVLAEEQDEKDDYLWINVDAEETPFERITRPPSQQTSKIKKLRSQSSSGKFRPQSPSSSKQVHSKASVRSNKLRTSQHSKRSVPSKVTLEPDSTLNVRSKKVDVKRGLFEFCLWEKRIADMADPKKGWLPSLPQVYKSDGDANQLHSISEDVHRKSLEYIMENRGNIIEIEENIFANTCVLLAIKQCVFENFYDSFQFKLIKLALRTSHSVITQRINEKWYVPKITKGDFKRPVSKKAKGKKKKKGGKKSSKGSKKGKKKGSKKSSSSKKSKKSKSSKSSKKSKKSSSKSSKKGKGKKLTKEEKEALAKQKLEERLREEELMKQMENKKFLFPLTDAVNDDFFVNLFENWVKPAKKEKKGKKGKGKGKKGKKK